MIGSKSNNQSKVFHVEVVEKFENPCGERNTFWLDVYYPHAPTVANKVGIHRQLAEIIDNVPSLRVFSPEYIGESRNLDVIIQEDGVGNVVATWAVACGTDIDKATDMMTEFLELNITHNHVMLSSGYYKSTLSSKLSKSPQTTTTSSYMTTTTLPSAQDVNPKLTERLSDFYCDKGRLCQIAIPASVFQDSTTFYNKNLTLYYHDKSENLLILRGKRNITGVPMKSGMFEFGLIAQDTNGVKALVKFRVMVRESKPTNHFVHLVLDHPNAKYLATHSGSRANFLADLSKALDVSINSLTIETVAEEQNKTLITFSESTIAEKACNRSALDELSSKMILEKKKRTKASFVRDMGSAYFVTRATIQLVGNCLSDLPLEASPVQSDHSNIFVFAAIGFIVIAVLAGISACLLKKKQQKKETDAEENRIDEEKTEEEDCDSTRAQVGVPEESYELKVIENTMEQTCNFCRRLNRKYCMLKDRRQ
ncbi:unnamed protein product [Caenorhabditis sp. 36 PRJEB53466]|nr:unnamed protein product [Caenorhabditis sp. 36 PRJEB53466]